MKKIGLSTFIFILFGVLIACSSGNTPEKTVENFFKNIAAKKFDQATAMVYLGDLNDAEMTQAKGKINMLLASAYADMEKSGGFKSIEIKSVKLSDDGKRATVQFTLNLNKKSNAENMQLINDAGVWKVNIK